MVFFSNLAARMIQPEVEAELRVHVKERKQERLIFRSKPAAKACPVKPFLFQQQNFNCKTV